MHGFKNTLYLKYKTDSRFFDAIDLKVFRRIVGLILYFFAKKNQWPRGSMSLPVFTEKINNFYQELTIIKIFLYMIKPNYTYFAKYINGDILLKLNAENFIKNVK